MRNLINSIKTATFLSTSLFCSVSLSAGSPLYDYGCSDYPAVAMVPYGESLSEFKATHGKVYHSQNRLGDILLYGPMLRWDRDKEHNDYNYHVFTVVFKDPDGHGKNAQVIGQLRHIRADGVITIIKTLDSNDYPVGSLHMASGLTQSDLQHRGGYYTVRVYVKRKNETVSPTVLGYSFCNYPR